MEKFAKCVFKGRSYIKKGNKSKMVVDHEIRKVEY